MFLSQLVLKGFANKKFRIGMGSGTMVYVEEGFMNRKSMTRLVTSGQSSMIRPLDIGC